MVGEQGVSRGSWSHCWWGEGEGLLDRSAGLRGTFRKSLWSTPYVMSFLREPEQPHTSKGGCTGMVYSSAAFTRCCGVRGAPCQDTPAPVL